MKNKWRRRGMKLVVIGTLAAAAFGFVVMSLWNWLAPAVFGGRTITFWQAFGLLILTRILFGGFRGRPGPHVHWRRRMMDRWEHMTPEDREKFREGWQGRCGGRDMPDTGPKVAAD